MLYSLLSRCRFFRGNTINLSVSPWIVEVFDNATEVMPPIRPLESDFSFPLKSPANLHPKKLDWTGIDLTWTGLCWTSTGVGHLDSTGLDWTWLDLTGLDWTGLDWTELDWTKLELNWTGLGLNLDRTSKTCTRLDEYNYHNSLQARLIEGKRHFCL